MGMVRAARKPKRENNTTRPRTTPAAILYCKLRRRAKFMRAKSSSTSVGPHGFNCITRGLRAGGSSPAARGARDDYAPLTADRLPTDLAAAARLRWIEAGYRGAPRGANWGTRAP